MYRIESDYFVAGLTLGNWKMTAPIIKYMAGWPFWRVFDYCAQKGWTLTELPYS